MFFRKSKPPDEGSLFDVVVKKTRSGYVFCDINNDLGHASDAIMAGTSLMKMAYGYARRAAMAAVYIQGLAKEENYSYSVSIFKGIQSQTESTVEFQERAARHSLEFMQTYSPLINSLTVRKLIAIANEYEISGDLVQDADLFSRVSATLFAEQQAARGVQQ